MTMQEETTTQHEVVPLIKPSLSSLEENDDDPQNSSGIFWEDLCSQSTVSLTPDNPLFGGSISNSSSPKQPLPTTRTTTTTTTSATTTLAVDSFPDAFDASPEPVVRSELHPGATTTITTTTTTQITNTHQYYLQQIREDQVSDNDEHNQEEEKKAKEDLYFQPHYRSTKLFYLISKKVFRHEEFAVATWIGFWALLNVTCANYVLSPMRDAVALQVGVRNIPKLTLASSVLALLSSVPIGWLFEAPDPNRRKVWKKMGLTRGETQGTSLALFYRFFALVLLSYSVGFILVDFIQTGKLSFGGRWFPSSQAPTSAVGKLFWEWIPYVLSKLGHVLYIAFFLVVHLAKLHSISLVWGVTSEAMEYEDVARKQNEQQEANNNSNSSQTKPQQSKTRLQRLALVGFGGTLGGIWGSLLASSMANILHLSGLLVVSACLLEISAELSIELGRIMQKHWEEQQIFKSCQDLASLDPSMKRSTSLGSMKRVASGNSLFLNSQNMNRVKSGDSINQSQSAKSLTELDTTSSSHNSLVTLVSSNNYSNSSSNSSSNGTLPPEADDNTFTQRLLRGITTILKSRLLMAIFTYNALFASTSVLLSFQRAELVANRNEDGNSTTSVTADTAFLANINMASSIAVFAMQASGVGAMIAQRFGSRGSLALMPVIRLLGVLGLAWWHRTSSGQPPNLILFLILDECTRVVNLAIAKPVRESLWRGLSNEARYEAKPIVDTLANRWGAGSASFCVSVVSKILLWLGMSSISATTTNGTTEDPQIFGLPPVLFLCLIVAAWWAMVSLDLGQIRKKIDMELKKRQ